ncbi:hypothetical protein Spa11_13980 [Botrimarina mediterranea]|uniref:Uncharacterized protein n=1 Tax=Botrimarina mediterranea TaxID=2528022 RepID=A0A518K5Y0_9BACT|nr:hypothetical protein Spa11_13980 [Botrimarina mediterranea]
MSCEPKMPEKYRLWKEIRTRLRLSDELVCMAISPPHSNYCLPVPPQ